MTKCVAVLLGTVQFRLKVKVVVPENATLKDAEKAALAAIEDDPIKNWTQVDEFGGAHSVQLAVNDFLEIGLQRVETAVFADEQPKVLWESED
jgi:hypothetical protein